MNKSVHLTASESEREQERDLIQPGLHSIIFFLMEYGFERIKGVSEKKKKREVGLSRKFTILSSILFHTLDDLLNVFF